MWVNFFLPVLRLIERLWLWTFEDLVSELFFNHEFFQVFEVSDLSLNFGDTAHDTLALDAVELLDLNSEVFFNAFHSGHLEAVFLEQGFNAQFAHPLVDFQSLNQSRDLSLGILSFNLIHVPAVLVHGLKLLLDILDGWCANLFEPSFQFSRDFLKFWGLPGFDGVLNIVLIPHEEHQVLSAVREPFEVHLNNVVAVRLRSSKNSCSEIIVHAHCWEVDQVLDYLSLEVRLTETSVDPPL